jgi:hypothetical protein
MVQEKDLWYYNLHTHVKKIYSQCGEEGMIDFIFKNITPTNKVAVEFGAGNGINLSNTRNLIQNHGWKGVLWDVDPQGAPDVHKEIITADNVNALLKKYKVPKDFDLLSLDIDGIDYYVWKAMTYKPKVVILECNAAITPSIPLAVPYDEKHVFENSDWFGASFMAYRNLSNAKGYIHVGTVSNMNMFFIREDLLPAGSMNTSVVVTEAHGWPRDPKNRQFVPVSV